jgi:hypothetical protein
MQHILHCMTPQSHRQRLFACRLLQRSRAATQTIGDTARDVCIFVRSSYIGEGLLKGVFPTCAKRSNSPKQFSPHHICAIPQLCRALLSHDTRVLWQYDLHASTRVQYVARFRKEWFNLTPLLSMLHWTCWAYHRSTAWQGYPHNMHLIIF